jgi:hypothetical protein
MIRPTVAALTMVVACALTATASAGTSHVVRTYAGITCTWPKETDGVVCQRAKGRGFAFAISQHMVLVRTARGRIEFFESQPMRSPGFGSLDDPTIFHRETHRGMTCYWSRLYGGGAGCTPANLDGYAAFVGHNLVLVLNEVSTTVFRRNQP